MNLPTSDLAALAWSQIWQVTALAIVVGIVTRLACRRRPHLAYVLWMLVLLKCLTPPLWSSPTGCFSWAQLRVVPAQSEVRSGDTDATADFDDQQRVATVLGHRDFFHHPHGSSPAVAPALPASPIVATSPVRPGGTAFLSQRSWPRFGLPDRWDLPGCCGGNGLPIAAR